MIRDYNILSEINRFGSFRALNATLSKENKMKLVSVEEFKELNKDSKNNTNWMVCHIEDVEVPFNISFHSCNLPCKKQVFIFFCHRHDH